MFYRVLGEEQGIAAYGIPGTDTGITKYVYTPKGTPVEVRQRYEMMPGQVTLENSIINSYPSATLLGNASYRYNCHSYAWYMETTTNPYWMQTPNAYWNDGSYYSISNSSGQLNDRVHYSSDHTAIIKSLHGTTFTLNYVISKWGYGPLVRHKMVDCPYVGGSVSYTTYRRA